MHIQFVLDYRSPYCYLANTQLQAMGVPVDYGPIDIVAVMKMVNNQPSPMCPPKAKYSNIDAMRWAKKYDVPYSPNWALLQAMRQDEIENTLLSSAGLAAQQLGVFESVNKALFEAVWVGTDNLATKAGRSAFLSDHAIPAALWDVAGSPEIEQLLAANNERAAQRGVFGVPTFFVGDEMFFGNDRLDFVRAMLPQKTGPTGE